MIDPHRTVVTSVIIVTAAWAYLASWLLDFANAGILALSGLVIGTGAAGVYGSINHQWGRWWEWSSMLILALGLFLLTAQVTTAMGAYDANEVRCAAIQSDMLAAKPRRQDGPNLFEALKCHPRGAAAVQFPAAEPVAQRKESAAPKGRPQTSPSATGAAHNPTPSRGRAP